MERMGAADKILASYHSVGIAGVSMVALWRTWER
jgi:hypothetical protein